MRINFHFDDPLDVCAKCMRKHKPLAWYKKSEIKSVDKTKRVGSSCELCDYDESKVENAGD